MHSKQHIEGLLAFVRCTNSGAHMHESFSAFLRMLIYIIIKIKF